MTTAVSKSMSWVVFIGRDSDSPVGDRKDMRINRSRWIFRRQSNRSPTRGSFPRDEVRSLFSGPTGPEARTSNEGSASTMATLVAIGYPDEVTATAAADEARRLARDLIIEPDAIAVIIRDKE